MMPTVEASTVDTWERAVTQVQDLQRREDAIADITRALDVGSAEARRSALEVLCRVAHVRFERAHLRPLLVSQANDSSAVIRALGVEAWRLYCLEPSDVGPLLELCRDASSSVRSAAARALLATGSTALPADTAILALLKDEEHTVVRDVLVNVGRRELSRQVEDRILELAKDPQFRRIVFRDTLRWVVSPSERVVDTLISALEDPVLELWATWALDRVDKDADPHVRKKVADAFVGLLESRVHPQDIIGCIDRISRYGSAGHATELEWLARSQAASEAVRARAREAIEVLRQRG
jgi:hypothetical protein